MAPATWLALHDGALRWRAFEPLPEETGNRPGIPQLDAVRQRLLLRSGARSLTGSLRSTVLSWP